MLVCGMVLCLDRQRQRLDRAQVQSRHFFHMPFLVAQPVEIHSIRSMDKVNDRQQQDGALPVYLAAENVDDPGNRRTQYIERKTPEVTLPPNAYNGAALQ